MAGLPDYTDNPIVSGNVGQTGDKSMEVALATKLQLQLDQPMTDVSTGLVNRDFEGDFFKIGDSVALVKPNIESINVQFGAINGVSGAATTNPAGKPLVDGDDFTDGTYSNKDARLIPSNVTFSKNVLTIDQYAKYAFYISDITNAEGRWNYESGNLDAAAQRLRKAHNLKTLQLIVDDAVTGGVGHVPTATAGTAASPTVTATGDAIYENVIVPMFAKLYDAGAITADGQLTYGSNASQGKATHACLYVPTDVYTKLLVSKYLQDRSTVAADEKVETGKVKTIMGMDIMIEPSLNPSAARHISLPAGADSGTVVVVAGTRNLVTRAGKVLKPDKFRSQKFFADEYHGMEIFGETIAEPKAGVVAFIKLSE